MAYVALAVSIKDAVFFLLLFLNNGILYSYFYTSSAYLSTEMMTHMFIRDTFTHSRGFQDTDNYNE